MFLFSGGCPSAYIKQSLFIHSTSGNGGKPVKKIPASATVLPTMKVEVQSPYNRISISHNRDKQRIRVAKVHEKVTNQRNDFLQKQSTMLVCENQTICIEDLHVKGMIRNHKLAKSIASVSWAKFFEMLEYKAVWYGNEIRKVPTMYPSSQTCSACGYRNPLVKNLRIRIWECPGCHAVHDRDTNAGINILKKGLQLQSA